MRLQVVKKLPPAIKIELLTKKSPECKLTLVSAPAGFGKTTLLSNWIHSRPSERAGVAWVSLDEGDNEPTLFWQYVLSALDRALPGLCAELVIYLQTQQAPPLRSVLQTLLNRLAAQPEQFLLILDDYHLLTEQAVHTTLTYLVEHLPPQLRVILTTRADPPLPFSLLRARGQLLGLRTDDLRCTPEEVVTFLKQIARIQLSEDVVESVASRTEGWLVGLQLVALSLQGRASPGKLLEEVEEVSGSQRYIFDYLIEEVFGRQSAAVQTFLLQTSILTQLSAPLCDAVLEQSGSQQMLEQLERANLFLVSLDGQRHWYRYHALFAEALQHRLEQMQPAVVPGLHSRASRWYARAGRLDEALSHALAAQEWPWAADLIEQVYPRIWGNSEHARLRRWLEQLPPEVLRSRPRLCLASAKTLFMGASGDILAAIQSIRKATALAQAGEDTSSTIIYLSRTAYSLLLHGKLHEVVQVARQATLLGATPAGLPHAMLCWAYIFHADALREWNRLDEALELALQSVRLSEQTETIVALYLGYTLLMRISLARKDMDAARLAFRKAEEGLQKTYSPYRRDAYLIVHWMQFWLASGEQERIRNWLQEIEQPGSVDTAVHAPLAHERQEVARVRMMLARQMPAEALALLESLLGRAEQQERWSHVYDARRSQRSAAAAADPAASLGRLGFAALARGAAHEL